MADYLRNRPFRGAGSADYLSSKDIPRDGNAFYFGLKRLQAPGRRNRQECA